jgi:hypothetical protein
MKRVQMGEHFLRHLGPVVIVSFAVGDVGAAHRLVGALRPRPPGRAGTSMPRMRIQRLVRSMQYQMKSALDMHNTSAKIQLLCKHGEREWGSLFCEPSAFIP